MKDLILAIDLGTSGPKIVLMKPSGEMVASTFRPTTLLYPGPNAVEQDPREWWTKIQEGISLLLSTHSSARANICAIACTGQWSGSVFLDAHGSPLGNAIIWMDSRGAPATQTLNRGLLNISGYGVLKLKSWIQKTGGAPGKSGKDSISHILYLKHEDKERFAKVRHCLEPKDFLNFMLTGEMASSGDTMALHWITDNRNLADIRYDNELIKMSGLSRSLFPTLRKSTDIVGNIKKDVAQRLGLPEGIPVIVSSPDLHCAAIGSGAVEDYAPHLCLGTSSWISCHVPFKKTDIISNIATLPSALPHRYFVANEQESAGVCLQYLNTLIGNPQSSDPFLELERLAQESKPHAKNIIFTPWLNGERTPVDDHFIRGGFHNLSLNSTRSDLVRSVYEGVAFNGKWLLNSVEKFVKRPLDHIHMIGGGAISEAWCQIYADILERTIKQVEHPRHANARGAAWLAALALGQITKQDIPKLIKFHKIFTPNESLAKSYNLQFQEFINLYRANKRIHKRLRAV